MYKRQGHTYQHEIRTAREAGVLGSLDANQGDKLIGWDMDCLLYTSFPFNLPIFYIQHTICKIVKVVKAVFCN